jgi:hypothetical protein
MSNFDHAIKKIKMFSADANSIAESSAEVIREMSFNVNLNGEAYATIACSGTT